MLRRRPILSLVTAAYLVFVGYVTLSPQVPGGDVNDWVFRALYFFWEHKATSWITYNDVEFVANMLMFLPIGLFLLLLLGRRSWWIVILFAFALTCSIELVQLLFLPGRVADVRDIVSNTTGGILGVLLGLALTARTARRAEAPSRAG